MTFDLERYQYQSEKIDLTGIEWDRAPDTPMSPQAIRSLVYMMDIEGHTSIYLAEILASKASLDPEITGFLHVWAYEEMFHSLALRRFLRSYGVEIPDSRPATVRAGDNAGRVKTTLAILVGSHLFDFFPAVYLCVGAINELTTLWAYQQLVARTGHPVLEELLRRIVRQERRHYAYYRWQAQRHLERSARTRRWTRRFLDRTFGAVGEGVKTQAEIDDLVLHLFSGDDGRQVARRIDAEISRLPGFQGAYLAERTLDRAEQHRRVTTTRHLRRESAAEVTSANHAIIVGSGANMDSSAHSAEEQSAA